MTLLHSYNGTPIENIVKLQNETTGYSASAVLGTPDIIRVIVEDPLAAYDFIGHKRWQMIEDACPPGDQTVWRGIVGQQMVRRAPGALTTTARQWELELIEDNTALIKRVLGWTSAGVPDTTANRPSETVSTRITWLLTQPGFTGIIYDRGLVEASSVVMDPTDYTNRPGGDVLQDCALASGNNYHVRFHEATNTLELIFLDALVSALDLSDLKISNSLADVDQATTWPPFRDGTLQRSPERVASGLVLPYANGTVYRTDAATLAAFGASDLVAPTASVAEATTATTLADHLLEQHATQEEQIQGLKLLLPDELLNEIKVGQRLDLKATHWPGFSAYRPVRVTQRSFARPANLSQDQYEVTYNLAAQILPVTTAAQLMRGVGTSHDLGGGLSHVHWGWTGDPPIVQGYGGTPIPLAGPIQYDGTLPSSSTVAGNLTGLTVLGSGFGVVTCAVGSHSVITGNSTATLTIRQNGVIVASFVDVRLGSGLRDLTFDNWNAPLVTGTLTITSGDVFDAYLSVTNWVSGWGYGGLTGKDQHVLEFAGTLASR